MKKIVALILCLALVIIAMPINAFALSSNTTKPDKMSE